MPKAKPGPPKSAADFSSNWKILQATLKVNDRKRKAEDGESDSEHVAKRKKDRQKPNGKQQEKSKFPDRGMTSHGVTVSNGKGKAMGTSKSDDKLHGKEMESKKTVEKNEIWFDDVDEIFLEREPKPSEGNKDSLVFKNAVTHVTKALALDCEMVGVGKEGKESVLARVSIVNQHGHCVYDKYVRPREKVTDFRTKFSGIRPHNLRTAEDFLVVQKEVSDLLKGKILVGHALHNDLKVLFLDHPKKDIRDTSRFKPFRQLIGGGTPALKKLTAHLLGVTVQKGEHNSVQDAQAAMRLYTMFRTRWEKELDVHRKGKNKKLHGKKKKKKPDNVAKEEKTDSSV